VTATEPDTQQEPPAEDPDWLKDLRREAKEAKDLRKEVADLKRGSVMDDLGIPKTGAGKLFRDTWSGDPGDEEALRKAAAEYELIPHSEDQPNSEVVEQALDASSGMAAAAAAGSSATPTTDVLLAEATSMDDIERIAQDAGVGVPIR
jgi:hypothetical protein